jgi:hypothetical protein
MGRCRRQLSSPHSASGGKYSLKIGVSKRSAVILVALTLITVLLTACTSGVGPSALSSGTQVPPSPTADGGPGTRSVVPTDPRNTLTIASPLPGAIITDVVTVKGAGRAYENTILVGVATQGTMLVKEVVTTQADTGEIGEFTVTLKLPAVEQATPATVVIYTESASDGSIDQKAEVPVQIVPAGTGKNTTAPVIRLMPDHGGSGTQVSVAGEKFPVGATVELRLSGTNTEATQQSYTSAVVDQNGSFKLGFTMPGYWPNGDEIIQPQIVVLASTPDFVTKASAIFGYDSELSSSTPSTDGASAVKIAEAFTNAWRNANVDEMLSYLDPGFRNSLGVDKAALAGAARMLGVQYPPASAEFSVVEGTPEEVLVRANLKYEQSTAAADLAMRYDGNNWRITQITAVP